MHSMPLRSSALTIILGLTIQVLVTAGLDAQAHQVGPGRARTPGLHRGGVDTLPRSHRFSLDLGVGVGSMNGFDDGRLLVAVTPRIRLLERARGRLTLALPLFVVPETHTSPRDLRLNPGLNADQRALLNRLGPRVGPSWLLAPSLEWTFRTDCCLQPSLFVGAGVRHDRSRSVPLVPGDTFEDPPRFTGDDSTAPIATFGLALECPVSRRAALRFETRGVVTFYRDTALLGPGGSRIADPEDDTVASVFVSLGVRLKL